MASTVYGESYTGYGVVDKNEMFAIASVHLKNKIAFGKRSSMADAFKKTDADKQTESMQIANAAVINALAGGQDLSNGADQWDGAEQAMIPGENLEKASNGRFMYKMNTMGWSMQNKHYESWKSNIEETFGDGKFTVPQTRKAMFNYGGMRNKGKTRLFSTAQYGLTIFWKTK